MISKQMVVRGLALASALLLGACGTTSQFAGYVTASDEDAKIVRAGGYSDAATAAIAIVQNPDFNGGKISAKALRKIQEYSMSCQRQIDPQLAGAGQSTLNGAVPYGGAGGVGTGLGAAAGFAGVHAMDYLKYGGIAYFFSGGVNGGVTGSYSMASAKGDCTRQFWEDVAKSDSDFKGTHVVIVHAGKAWGNSAPPALDRSAVTPPRQPVLDRSLIQNR